MKNKPPLDSPSQIILGVLVIGLGLVFLLDNLVRGLVLIVLGCGVGRWAARKVMLKDKP